MEEGRRVLGREAGLSHCAHRLPDPSEARSGWPTSDAPLAAPAFTYHVPGRGHRRPPRRLALTRCPIRRRASPGPTARMSATWPTSSRYWRDGFDWREEEAWLNAFPQFKVQLARCRRALPSRRGEGPEPAAAAPLPWLAGLGLRVPEPHSAPDRSGPVRRSIRRCPSRSIAPSLPGYGLSFAARPGAVRRRGDRATGWSS